MSTTNIGPIDGQPILYDPITGLVEFSSKGDCDCDGPGGSLAMDPDWQPETTLQWLNLETGKHESIDSCVVPGVVVSQIICRKTRLQVLGCQAEVSFDNGPWIDCVAYDIGDTKAHPRIGEFSFALHKLAKTGGTPRGVPSGDRYRTRIHTGVPAQVRGTDGVLRQYDLQSYRA